MNFPIEKLILHKKKFLSKKECDSIIQYYEDNKEKKLPVTQKGAHARIRGRVLYFLRRWTKQVSMLSIRTVITSWITLTIDGVKIYGSRLLLPIEYPRYLRLSTFIFLYCYYLELFVNLKQNYLLLHYNLLSY